MNLYVCSQGTKTKNKQTKSLSNAWIDVLSRFFPVYQFSYFSFLSSAIVWFDRFQFVSLFYWQDNTIKSSKTILFYKNKPQIFQIPQNKRKKPPKNKENEGNVLYIQFVSLVTEAGAIRRGIYLCFLLFLFLSRSFLFPFVQKGRTWRKETKEEK